VEHGHGTETMVLARCWLFCLLAMGSIIAVSRNIDWHRIQIDRHCPTDVFVGGAGAAIVAK